MRQRLRDVDEADGMIQEVFHDVLQVCCTSLLKRCVFGSLTK